MADHAQALRKATKDYTIARRARDNAIRAAHKGGKMSYRAIGELVGLSYARVAQIVNDR